MDGMGWDVHAYGGDNSGDSNAGVGAAGILWLWGEALVGGAIWRLGVGGGQCEEGAHGYVEVDFPGRLELELELELVATAEADNARG